MSVQPYPAEPYQPTMAAMTQQQMTTNVTIVNQQPAGLDQNKLIIGPLQGHRGWTTDLFGCCDDCGSRKMEKTELEQQPPQYQAQAPVASAPQYQASVANVPQYQVQAPVMQAPVMQAPQPQTMQQNTTNVVVVNQPAKEEGNKLLIGSIYGHRDWTTGLFSCTEDVGGCFKSMMCVNCVLMEIAAKLNENLFVAECIPNGTVIMRTRLRTLGGIEGSIMKDYLAYWCCPFCVICQMERELHAMRL